MTGVTDWVAELQTLWNAVHDADAMRVAALLTQHPQMRNVLDQLHPRSPYSPIRLDPLLDPSFVGVDWSPLHWASWHGDEATASLLLQHGAPFDQRDFSGDTPLIFAVQQGHAQVAELLLNKGAESNGRMNEPEEEWDEYMLRPAERGPLHWASLRGDSALVAQLLAYGATINLPDVDGNTALHLATIQNRVEAAQVLLAAKGDPNLKNHEGETALELARCYVNSFGGNEYASTLNIKTVFELMLNLNLC